MIWIKHNQTLPFLVSLERTVQHLTSSLASPWVHEFKTWNLLQTRFQRKSYPSPQHPPIIILAASIIYKTLLSTFAVRLLALRFGFSTFSAQNILKFDQKTTPFESVPEKTDWKQSALAKAQAHIAKSCGPRLDWTRLKAASLNGTVLNQWLVWLLVLIC